MREGVGVVGVRRKERGEVSDAGGQLGHLGAGSGEVVQERVLFGLEVVRPGQQHPGEPARGDMAAVGVRAALVDVLVQQVQTTGEPEGLDLFEV
ncbi:hypothetical protein BG418_01030 [Streptomyces sp. CBMA152]|nr:hypothetical protein [Streptomyces sp. CBMA152]